MDRREPATVVRVSEGFDRAVALLRRGELVAFPTDTVYGVGAVVWDQEAVGRLYAAKLRSPDKAIPVLVADAADLGVVARDVSPSALRLAQRFWPGPLTLVVPRAPGIPDVVNPGGESIAVRLPDHAVARDLIRAVGSPLATTSANLSGRSSAITAQEVADQLEGQVALILDAGRCPGGVASTVVDVTGPEPVLLRAGPIGMDAIMAALA